MLLKVGDNVSTDEIMPAGAPRCRCRTNIPELAQFAFSGVDERYPTAAMAIREQTATSIVGGDNYGQGSSREHAAIVPRYLGPACRHRQGLRAHPRAEPRQLRGLAARSSPTRPTTTRIEQGDTLSFSGMHDQLQNSSEITATVGDTKYTFRHQLSPRQV